MGWKSRKCFVYLFESYTVHYTVRPLSILWPLIWRYRIRFVCVWLSIGIGIIIIVLVERTIAASCPNFFFGHILLHILQTRGCVVQFDFEWENTTCVLCKQTINFYFCGNFRFRIQRFGVQLLLYYVRKYTPARIRTHIEIPQIFVLTFQRFVSRPFEQRNNKR